MGQFLSRYKKKSTQATYNNSHNQILELKKTLGSRPDTLNNTPFEPLPFNIVQPIFSTFLDRKSLVACARTNKNLYTLFQPALSLQALMDLIVNYQLNDNINAQQSLSNGLHPILNEVDKILEREPKLALKQTAIKDKIGRTFYGSPFVAAHWTGNWALRELIYKHIQYVGKQFTQIAKEQINAWNERCYAYDLLLFCTEKNTFPRLTKIPSLIKQYDGTDAVTFYQWGEVNGAWRLSQLDNPDPIINTLPFPDYKKEPVKLEAHQLSKQTYDFLKKSHNINQIDLYEYINAISSFFHKYPIDSPIFLHEYDGRLELWAEVGKAQLKMPAWIAALWCSKVVFQPIPDFKHLIFSPMKITFKFDLYHFYDEQLDCRLGHGYSMIKGDLPCPQGVTGYGGPPPWLAGRGRNKQAPLDKQAMIKLNRLIKCETKKFLDAMHASLDNADYLETSPVKQFKI